MWRHHGSDGQMQSSGTYQPVWRGMGTPIIEPGMAT
jgi:hypothetical protein